MQQRTFLGINERLSLFITLLLITSAILLSPAIMVRGDSNSIGSGAIFQSGFGARALGMGGAFVAIADDYSATYWNPAGVTRATSIYLGGMRYDKFGLGLNLDYLSGGLPLMSSPEASNSFIPNISLPLLEQFSLSASYLGFSTDVRTLGPGGSEIPITYAERSILATAGLQFPVLGSLGVSVKNYMYSAPDAGIDGENASANGLGFDIGLLSEPVKNFSIGAAAFDLTGTSIQWHNTPSEPTDLIPARYSLGAAYKFDFSAFSITDIIPGTLTVAGQYSFGPDIEAKARAGLEYVFSLLSLRAGAIKPLESDPYLTAGAGLRIRFIRADLAWIQNTALEGEETTDTIVFSTQFDF